MISMTYRERLTPPLLWWVIGMVIGLTFVVAVAAILPLEAAAASLVVVIAVVVGVLAGTSPIVGVGADAVVARRATLPLSAVGTVTTLSGEALHRRMGTDADPRAFLVYRAFCPEAVEIEVVDPADPHPYWLVSSRDAKAFATAISTEVSRATTVA